MNTEFTRSFFPGLESPWIFMDNAGGSQINKMVTERILEFYRTSFVQLGASYTPSLIASDRVTASQVRMAEFINASDACELVMGSSTSLLLRILALNLAKHFPKGSEIIVTNCDHEANIGCWRELEKAGMFIKTWKLNPESLTLEVSDLEKLITRQTRLVAFTHSSNILGTVNPVQEITRIAHSQGAMVCVDGVAYAPHRMIDVADWDVDFYVFSFYKTFGPHYAMLYGKKSILLNLPGNNHYFIGQEQSPYKFQPGNLNFEFAWGIAGLPDYYDTLYHSHFPGDEPTNFRQRLSEISKVIQQHEQRLSNKILTFLNSKSKIRIIGQPQATETRVPTISFVVKDTMSESIVEKMDEYKIGIRFGDFYAKRLIEDLELESYGGVVRISLVHYNTAEEVDQLINALDHII
jgi:cysteine desulfurase family protein (TIGR01976 family)